MDIALVGTEHVHARDHVAVVTGDDDATLLVCGGGRARHRVDRESTIPVVKRPIP